MAVQKKFAVWVTDGALMLALKLEATRRGVTLRSATTEAIRAWVQSPPLASAPAGRKKPQKAAERPVESLTYEPVCRRCYHPETSHWIRGCRAGCMCREFVA